MKFILIGWFLTITVFAGPAEAVFTLTLDGYTALDFGTLSPGSFKEHDVSTGTGYVSRAKCQTSNGTTWYLKTRLTQLPTDSSSGKTIAEGGFRWMSTYAGIWVASQAAWYDLKNGLSYPPEGGFINFTTTDVTLYTAGTTPVSANAASYPAGYDKSNSPDSTEIGFKFAYLIPSNQTSGTYTTTLRFTMTE